jgi:hypothetical protein
MSMTRLEKAFEEASKLPEEEQEILANWILEEIASEKQWDDRFRSSPDRLSALAEEALQELEADRTQDLDPDNL